MEACAPAAGGRGDAGVLPPLTPHTPSLSCWWVQTSAANLALRRPTNCQLLFRYSAALRLPPWVRRKNPCCRGLSRSAGHQAQQQRVRPPRHQQHTAGGRNPRAVLPQRQQLLHRALPGGVGRGKSMGTELGWRAWVTNGNPRAVLPQGQQLLHRALQGGGAGRATEIA